MPRSTNPKIPPDWEMALEGDTTTYNKDATVKLSTRLAIQEGS
jgi:hypothetical protein